MRRYELTDEQFELIQDLLPKNGGRGGQWNDHRTTLNGIFWILHSGAQWREVPERYGKWQSVYDRFVRWRRDGPVRRWLRRHRVKAVIPTKSNQPRQAKFDRRAYRRRNVVERCVNWLKENRRLGTRYEKLAVNFEAMAKYAMIRRYFRILDSS